MNFQDLNIEISYISYGEENIAKSLINPALKISKYYKRSVGFFSSSVLELILSGVMGFVKHGEQIQLITSIQLNEDDVIAIELGYKSREDIINDFYKMTLDSELSKLTNDNLKLLYQLIKMGKLDIKVAMTKGNGIYHDKFGILEDYDGNKIVFFGSANSSKNGYKNNYEKIRVVKSWDPASQKQVEDEVEEFNNLWFQTNEFVEVIPFSDGFEKKLLSIIERNNSSNNTNNQVVRLRDYQKEAVESWVNNDYHGFFVMATGTGKTWTAIFSAAALIEKHPCMIIIAAPYKHLVKQWAEDVTKMLPKAAIILVSSENVKWETEVADNIIRQRIEPQKQIVIITTITSFNLPRFRKAISKSKQDKLLIVDEAHRFTKRDEEIQNKFQYLLGLSATPFNGKDITKGNELMSFFGGNVYNLPIEVALEKKFLVPYYYHPIFVSATEDEEERFNKLSSKIAGCYKNNILIDPENLVKYLRNRLRIISMSEEKQLRLPEILENVKEKRNLIVYCGDGKCYDSTIQEIKHINFVKRHLNEKGYKTSQFTASENMSERMSLVDSFVNGTITALAAIKCLDEGINIPSIEGALILSSNDDFREFTQRRGRILRTFGDKKYANIYDVIVLPSSNCRKIAEIELRRYFEYAKLSINASSLIPELESLMNEYELSYDDISFNFEEEIVDELDE